MPEMKDAWIQTLDGRQFFPMDPDPALIDPLTIATVLSRICRFGGHCKEVYSVAQYSINVCALIDDPELKLPALLHDAHEAYSGFGDVCSPMKRMLRGFTSVLDVFENVIDVVVAQRFGFDPELFKRPEIRHADLVMLATEKKFLMLPEPAPWAELPEPLDELPRGSLTFVGGYFLELLERYRGT